MAFDKHLFIANLTGENGRVAQADALAEIDNFLEREFVTEREAELEESFAALGEDFDAMEDENAVLFGEIKELKMQFAELKGESIGPFDFKVLDE